jgi:hypothetical protein
MAITINIYYTGKKSFSMIKNIRIVSININMVNIQAFKL